VATGDFDFNALFEDPAHGGFGCVLFDFVDAPDGRSAPAMGPGWASVGGQKAQRIKSVEDLAASVKWLTNLERQSFWKSGAVKFKKLRESSFLKTDLGQIMRETGIVTRRVTTAGACEQAAEIFSRSMGLGMAHYGLDEMREQEWLEELRPRLAPPDAPLRMEVDEALRRCFIDYVETSSDRVEGGKLVTLRRPRLSHAKSVLATAIPQGEWEFIGPDALPDPHARFDFLWDTQRPALVKVAMKGFGDRCPPHVPQLLQMGEVWGENGHKKERTWMTLQEVKYFSRYAKMEIQSAFLAQGWMDFQGGKRLLEMGELSDFSISLGLLAEAHWMALSGRSRNPQARLKKNLVSPRAAWFRATDRFLCFSSALPLAAAGFAVTAYGGGTVSVSARGQDMASLAQIASESGLSVPAVLFDQVAHDRESHGER
jgi:hypothetical protein